jgi:hypothetical protein
VSSSAGTPSTAGPVPAANRRAKKRLCGGAVPSWAVVSGPAMKTEPLCQIRSRQPSGRIRVAGVPGGTVLRQAMTCGS